MPDTNIKQCEDFMYYHTDGTLQLIVREMESTDGNRYRGHFRFLYGPDGVSGCIYNTTETRTPVLYTYVRNALGDIVYICDENYNIKAEYVYDAYGNCKIKNDTTNGFARNNPFRYRGYFYDTETGFYYCQTRYYNPAWGRFISMDDVDYVDPQAISGLNLYAYCNGDPVNFSDPTGQLAFLTCVLIGAGIGAIWGLGKSLYEDCKDNGQIDGSISTEQYVKNILVDATLGAGVGAVCSMGTGYIFSGLKSVFSKGISDIVAAVATGTPINSSWEDYALSFVAGGIFYNAPDISFSKKALFAREVCKTFFVPLFSQGFKSSASGSNSFNFEKFLYGVGSNAVTRAYPAGVRPYLKGLLKGWYSYANR